MTRPLVDEVDARILPGLIGWYRAETMKEKFGDGQEVTYIYDESGNGNHMEGATGPDFVSDGINGFASLSFDSANLESLIGAATYGAVVRGVYAVVKRATAGNWGTSATTEGFFGGQAAGNISIVGTNGTTNINGAGGTSTDYVNGVQTDAVSNTNAWNLVYSELATLDSLTGIVMGRLNAGNGFFGGEIAECGAFTTTPSSADRTAFFNHIIAKYAITGDVGSP